MNPDPFSRDELEARLTALLLGELPAEEARALHAALAQDPELARLHAQLARTIGLVRTASTSAADPATEAALKLSAARRAELLAHFQTPRPEVGPPIQVPVPKPQPGPAESFWQQWLRTPSPASVFVTAFATLFILAVLAGLLMPSLAAAKRGVSRGTLGTAAMRQQAQIPPPRQVTGTSSDSMTLTVQPVPATNMLLAGSALAGRDTRIVLPPATTMNWAPSGDMGGNGGGGGAGGGSGGRVTVLHPQPVTGLPAAPAEVPAVAANGNASAGDADGGVYSQKIVGYINISSTTPMTPLLNGGTSVDAPKDTEMSAQGLRQLGEYGLAQNNYAPGASGSAGSAMSTLQLRQNQMDKRPEQPEAGTTYAQRNAFIVNPNQFYSGSGNGNGSAAGGRIDVDPKTGWPVAPAQTQTEEKAAQLKTITLADSTVELGVNKDASGAVDRFYRNATNVPDQASTALGDLHAVGRLFQSSNGGGGPPPPVSLPDSYNGSIAGGAAPAQRVGGETNTVTFSFTAGNDSLQTSPAAVFGDGNGSAGGFATPAAPARNPVNQFVSRYAGIAAPAQPNTVAASGELAGENGWEEKAKLERLETMHTLLGNKIEAERLDVSIPKSQMVSIIDFAEPGKSKSVWQKLTGKVESTARIKVERDSSDVAGFSASDAGVNLAAYDPNFIQDTFALIRSEVVLGKVVDALKLDEAWAKNNGGVKLTRQEAMRRLKDRLDVSAVKNTKLISIGVLGDAPQEAASLANATAAAYRDYRQEQVHEQTAKALDVLQRGYAEQEQAIAKARSNVNRLNPKSGAANGEPAGPVRKTATNAPVPQPEIQTSVNAFSTFSLNVSDVSFQLAAASLANGQLPEASSIRSEEFINAFDYRDPEAPASTPIAFMAERAAWPFAHHRDLLRFSLKTGAAGRAAGRPLNLVLLLDNSGSMERADRVAIIREALRGLAGQLHPQDTVSVVTFARTARLWVDGVAGDKAGAVFDRVGGLTPQGGTNLEEALRLAYEAARRHFRADGLNRVVLLTDGAANLGTVDADLLKQKVEASRKQGIALDCFGIGWEGYNDDLLEQLSSNGDGRYAFLNSPEQAAGEFAAKLAGALQVAAEDVKVQVEFNPERVAAYRQIGYAKHQLTKEQFRDNTVSAAPIAAQEAGNALYTIELRPDGTGPVATVHVRYRTPGTQDYHEHAWTVPYTGSAPALARASAALRLAGTAGAFAEWLAASPYAQAVTPDELLGYLNGVPETYGADPRPEKLEWMIRQAKRQAGK